ncbi:hypothetical protein BTO06_14925 [Tenacibaculum sp. SZ-18]|uniref:hypothetical protein n=1 Tax=Tenacibaculum sp. SZ-18 TaxID=754423 RepID=UPI000C2CFA19|nr:hypothetical protein [Tenacibaculum sp. SZ-18]AUC16363.1 hypothetical protein BTO06_14925 [Tenacibaculum sp. SZ-18]
MKYFKLIVILFTSLNGVSQKSNISSDSIQEIVFNAQTRGKLENITISDKAIFYKTYETSKTFGIDSDQKKQLTDLIKKIDLQNISNIKAPSNKRAFDGALQATLSIKTESNNYVSSQFDDDNPPKKLKVLIELMKTLCKE